MILQKYKLIIIHIAIILGVNVLYFLPQIQGKVLKANDTVQWESASKETRDFRAKGDDVLWNNSMFSGMPNYQISPLIKGNMVSKLQIGLQLFFNFPMGIFIMGMLFFYLLLYLLDIKPWLCLLGSLFFGLSTNNFILLEAGHATKLTTLFYAPLIISGAILLLKNRYTLGSLLYALGFALSVYANHVQMTYYLGLCMFILVILFAIQAIKEKTVLSYTKALVLFGATSIIAVATNTTNLWTTYEYSADTMRGKPILASESTNPENQSSSSTVDGLAWDYAMQWSNGSSDLLATFIPKIVGGSSAEWLDGKSVLGKGVGQRQAFQAPTYFGALPFTSGPIYFGAIAMLLFVFGLFVVKGNIKWWLFGSVLLTMLLSMGNNFEGFNRIFFDYFPLFNKFRAPSSILGVTAVFIPILGILGLSEIYKSENKKQFVKPLLISASILGGISFILYVMGGSILDYTTQGDEQYADIKDLLLRQREAMSSSSALRTLFLVGVASGSIYAFLSGKISFYIMLGLVGLFGIGDLVDIDRDYLNKRNFVTPKNLSSEHEPRPVDTQILQDSDPYYRVYDASINSFNSASSSYFHKTIGGYHAAKLQRYQDVIERHISQNNMAVLNMLNTKYFIIPDQQGNPIAQSNPDALGNAWFVDDIKIVDNANQEIDGLTNLKPDSVAIIHQEFNEYIKSFNPQKNGSIKLTSYHPDKLEYDSETQGDQLAIFSDIWYGPNKGWNAYIDGKPVEHIRANYILRSLKIPSGKHKVTFEFKPQSYYMGENISLFASLLLIGLLIAYIVWEVWKYRKHSLVKS